MFPETKFAVFLELRSRRAVRFSEHIMSADKYPSIFSLLFICNELFNKSECPILIFTSGNYTKMMYSL